MAHLSNHTPKTLSISDRQENVLHPWADSSLFLNLTALWHLFPKNAGFSIENWHEENEPVTAFKASTELAYFNMCWSDTKTRSLKELEFFKDRPFLRVCKKPHALFAARDKTHLENATSDKTPSFSENTPELISLEKAKRRNFCFSPTAQSKDFKTQKKEHSFLLKAWRFEAVKTSCHQHLFTESVARTLFKTDTKLTHQALEPFFNLKLPLFLVYHESTQTPLNQLMLFIDHTHRMGLYMVSPEMPETLEPLLAFVRSYALLKKVREVVFPHHSERLFPQKIDPTGTLTPTYYALLANQT